MQIDTTTYLSECLKNKQRNKQKYLAVSSVVKNMHNWNFRKLLVGIQNANVTLETVWQFHMNLYVQLLHS